MFLLVVIEPDAASGALLATTGNPRADSHGVRRPGPAAAQWPDKIRGGWACQRLWNACIYSLHFMKLAS
jgi:hypothetical protein